MYLCTVSRFMSLPLCSPSSGYAKGHHAHEQRQHHRSSVVSSTEHVARDSSRATRRISSLRVERARYARWSGADSIGTAISDNVELSGNSISTAGSTCGRALTRLHLAVPLAVFVTPGPSLATTALRWRRRALFGCSYRSLHQCAS